MDSRPLLTRPTYAEINLVQLIENYKAIKQKVSPAAVMPVIKANAYGHGLVPVAKKLVQEGVSMLAVAILDEGLTLRQAGIRIPVLILGGILEEQIEAHLNADLILTVSSVDSLKQINQSACSMGVRAKVHIKIDTGMGRLGVFYDTAEDLLRLSLSLEHIQVAGIYSHFASSDEKDLSYAKLQLERFRTVLQFYDREGLPRPLTHMANSGAVLQMPESYFDMVRPGIMLYGVYPSSEVSHSVKVQQVLSWKTRSVLSKILPPKSPVSYGSTWQSEHACRILTLPLGYGDGYLRALSNKGIVLVGGKRCPVVGRVCMDQIMVNLEQDEAGVGDEVILIGTQAGETISVADLADLAGTIGYEILTNINTRVPRVYLNS